MTLFSKLLATTLPAAALCLTFAGAPLAQETTTEEATTEEAAVTNEGADTDGGFDMGEEVDENGNPVAPEPQEPQVGQQYLSEVFNDWAMRCLKTGEAEDPCQIYQLLQDESGAAVAEIAVVSLPGGGNAAAGATIVVPLETLLTEQLVLRVDGGTARRFPYSFCNQGGCVARIGFTAEDVALFKRGNAATLRMVPAAAPDEAVVVTMSLSGFTAGFNAISE